MQIFTDKLCIALVRSAKRPVPKSNVHLLINSQVDHNSQMLINNSQVYQCGF